jgi:hypothetical protein
MIKTCCALGAMLLTTVAAQASVVYSYVGAKFNQVSNDSNLEVPGAIAPSTSDFVSFSVTLDTALANGSSTQLCPGGSSPAITVLAWTMGASGITVGSATGNCQGLASMQLGVDASGALTSWNIQYLVSSGALTGVTAKNGIPSLTGLEISTTNPASGNDSITLYDASCGAGYCNHASNNSPINQGPAGSWTVTVVNPLNTGGNVPEPSSVLLACLALAAATTTAGRRRPRPR